MEAPIRAQQRCNALCLKPSQQEPGLTSALLTKRCKASCSSNVHLRNLKLCPSSYGRHMPSVVGLRNSASTTTFLVTMRTDIAASCPAGSGRALLGGCVCRLQDPVRQPHDPGGGLLGTRAAKIPWPVCAAACRCMCSTRHVHLSAGQGHGRQPIRGGRRRRQPCLLPAAVSRYAQRPRLAMKWIDTILALNNVDNWPASRPRSSCRYAAC